MPFELERKASEENLATYRLSEADTEKSLLLNISIPWLVFEGKTEGKEDCTVSQADGLD